jgi:hypothetical protein
MLRGDDTMARWERLDNRGYRTSEFVQNGLGIDFVGDAVALTKHFENRLVTTVDAYYWISELPSDTFDGLYSEVVVLKIYDAFWRYVAA